MQSSSQLPKQDYEALQERCLIDGCLFEDQSFPATLRSIGRGPLLRKLPERVYWRRPPVRGGGIGTTARSVSTQTLSPGLRILFTAIDPHVKGPGSVPTFPFPRGTQG